MKCNTSLQKMKQVTVGMSIYRRSIFFCSCLFRHETSQPPNLRDVALELREGDAVKWCGEWVIQTYQDEKHGAEMHYCYHL